MVSFPSNHYNKLYIITIGDYTEQGYKRKKEKLEAEFEVAAQSDPLVQVQSDAKKLSVVTQESTQMSETIAKLFKKPASAPKSLSLSKPAKGKSVAKAQKPVLKVLETVVVPERTTTIPQRNAREVLQKKGYIKMIRVEKRDSEPTVRNKVHEAFPLVFSKGESIQFQFLSAKSRSLADVAPQDLGYATWTGDAVTALAGQGCLYVLLLHSSVKVCTDWLTCIIFFIVKE